jgi:uncharacterized membrane protein YgdD (TMEM256/DUF423 family)
MKNLFLLGSVYMFLGVGLGAFGAHGLQARLTQLGTLETYKTGVQYHLIHALALLFLALLYDKVRERRRLEVCGWLFAIGILLFSGSLYVYAVSGVKILGAVTPFGGLCFLIAWALLAWTASRE